MSKSPHILILGLGSAGKRHWRNLASLGCVCSGMDPREDRRAETTTIEGYQGAYGSVEEALQRASFDGCVIASPPSFHIPQLNAVLAAPGLRAVLCEKPLSTLLQATAALEGAAQDRVLLGYTYRWWPPLIELRRRIQRGDIGAVRHVRAVMAAHLEDWHPWERYQDFFMSSAEQGGGALLDESHVLDLVRWIFGMPEALYASVERLSELDISTDDNVDILMTYPDRKRISIHLDLYARPHERQITVVGERGTLRWSYERNVVELGREGEQKWETETFTCERNEMFLGAAREFLALLEGGATALTCTVEDGREALRLIEACRKSEQMKRRVPLAEVAG
jgi:predicted dehydrogenase